MLEGVYTYIKKVGNQVAEKGSPSDLVSYLSEMKVVVKDQVEGRGSLLDLVFDDKIDKCKQTESSIHIFT